MCGRFALHHSSTELAEVFGPLASQEMTARYNIAPTQLVAIIRSARSSEPTLTPAHWGLIPGWAKDRKIANKLINARSETVAEKPSFRQAFKSRRCLLPVSGYYEWSKVTDDAGKITKVPYYISSMDGEPLALAGLWESWRSPEGEDVESCAILTVEANSYIAPIHHRMPVILHAPDHRATWLCSDSDRTKLAPLLSPHAPPLSAYPVSTAVNRATNDTVECIQRIEVH